MLLLSGQEATIKSQAQLENLYSLKCNDDYITCTVSITFLHSLGKITTPAIQLEKTGDSIPPVPGAYQTFWMGPRELLIKFQKLLTMSDLVKSLPKAATL